MYEKLIDKIVWWIPLKKIRCLIRDILNNILYINNINNEINNNIKNINNINNEINNNILNIIISNFTEIYDNDTKNCKYDFIFSIGENCFTAHLLSQNNLRTKSSPFDWVTPLYSNNNNIIKNLEIIKNRFYNFFNKEDFKFAFKGDNNHNVYFNTNTSLYYPHDFDYNIEFDIDYRNNLNKYNRRINELIKDLESNKKILMVYIEYYRLENNLININNIINYIMDIRKVYNNNNIYLLYVKHNYYINEEKIYFKNIDKKIDFYILDNSFDYQNHKEDLSGWCNNFEKTNKILNRYKLTIDDL